ncbi:Nramp family divalent metal transporter [Thermodesulfobium acidiphilum]|uniref:Nramp family divalent metal transporter n=1 Tax=Thermodesulfobium acidiphilum TaxID=1794699 RepID=UPI000D3B61E2
MISIFKELKTKHKANLTVLNWSKYFGPGILITVGFIDPGNWASNIAAGSDYSYSLLWMVTLSTIMLILLQQNASKIGMVTGLCMSEATMKFLKPIYGYLILGTAVTACIFTYFAEVLGAAIALNMLFKIPLILGAVFTSLIVVFMLYSQSYAHIEKYIIAFVSLIGFSFIYELSIINVDWRAAVVGWVVPSMPHGSIFVILSVLGAVVMPHNLFLHSEIVQSRKFDISDEKKFKKQIRMSYLDTIFSMGIGWAINSAMIILAAATFFAHGLHVDELQKAQKILVPLIGDTSSLVFALALLFAGFSSSITASMAGGTIFAGIFSEPYDVKDIHTKGGIFITVFFALLLMFFTSDPFQGLLLSQVLLSFQLPITIILQLYLTSRTSVMGIYKNSRLLNAILWIIAIIVIYLNALLLLQT